jgi:hypothetical protein
MSDAAATLIAFDQTLARRGAAIGAMFSAVCLARTLALALLRPGA